jgi:hypothetical protein
MTRTNQHDAPVAEYDVLTLVAKSLTYPIAVCYGHPDYPRGGYVTFSTDWIMH